MVFRKRLEEHSCTCWMSPPRSLNYRTRNVSKISMQAGGTGKLLSSSYTSKTRACRSFLNLLSKSRVWIKKSGKENYTKYHLSPALATVILFILIYFHPAQQEERTMSVEQSNDTRSKLSLGHTGFGDQVLLTPILPPGSHQHSPSSNLSR